MKYTHKLLTGIVLLGSAGFLIAAIGTGGAVVSGQTTPGGAIVGSGGEVITPGGAV